MICIIIHTPYLVDAIRIKNDYMRLIKFDIPILIYGDFDGHHNILNLGCKEVTIQEETFARGNLASSPYIIYTFGLIACAQGGQFISDNRIIHILNQMISKTIVYDLLPYNLKKIMNKFIQLLPESNWPWQMLEQEKFRKLNLSNVYVYKIKDLK